MILALTGGIACGKSLVLKIFSSFNWNTADADLICHRFYDEKNDYLYERFRQQWGTHFFDNDGLIDRRKLAAETFSNPQELEKLNGIIHPMFKAVVRKMRADIAASGRNLMIEVPLLFEAGMQKDFDAVICVYSSLEHQRERLEKREDWPPDHIDQRIFSQWPAEKKLELADYGVINNDSVQSLEQQCRLINFNIRKQR